MKTSLLLVAVGLGITFACVAGADEVTPSAPVVIAQNPGPSAFISFLTVSAADLSTIRAVHFTIAPKPGSVTRPNLRHVFR